MKLKKVYLLIAIILPLFAVSKLHAQGGKTVVQFSGVVVSGDSMFGVPGVHIYVPKAGRGTTTSEYGYFSLPTLAGDSLIVSAIGFKKKWVTVPDDGKQYFTVVIELNEDTTMLPMVEIFPYPTFELFKQAFVALQLPEERNYAKRNLSEEKLRQIIATTPMDGGMNQLNYTQQQIAKQSNRGMVPMNPLLNPFAWATLIKQIRDGEFKKRKDMKN
jgi:hypothetical protein